MSSESSANSRLYYLVNLHAVLVLTVGLVAGVILVFSLLDAVNLWPFPVWKVAIPGSTRGWQAAHVGGIMNGIMLIALGYLMGKLALSPRQYLLCGWGLIATGWGNTVFYWAGNVAPNRGLSMVDTPFGAADIAGALAFLGGGCAMLVTFAIMFIFARAALQQLRAAG
jgi:styrene-oxide isomerase